jgi:hypothetical protein
MKNFPKKRALLIATIFLLGGCGQECYTSNLQVKAKYEHCSDLGSSYSPKVGSKVWTFVCTTSGDDKFFDFVEKDGKLCRTYRHEY